MQGKNILIIGASSGVGAALREQLQATGANLWLASRHIEAGEQCFQYDATDADAKLGELPEQLHGLVYCPGSITLKPFAGLKRDDFLQDFTVNVLGAAQAIQQALKPLKKAGGSSVVLFSTVAVAAGMNFHASIATAKAGVEGLAKSLAAELAGAKVRVNVIAPSLTDTPLAKQLLSSDDKRQAAAKRHPLNQVGEPEQIAALAAFLLSEQAAWMTGQIIGVDGGLANLRPLT